MKVKRYNPVPTETRTAVPQSSGGASTVTAKLSAVLEQISRSVTRFNIRRSLSAFLYRLRTLNGKGTTRKFLPLAILILFALAAVGLLVRNLRSPNVPADARIAIAGPIATVILNKEFQFPLKDDKGKEVTKIKYTIKEAELRNEIIVKGKRAVAVQGRTFLILNLKVVNDYNQALTMNVRDYIRLSLNGNKTELLAPEIHNDPVAIQAISKKDTRVGFPINDTDRNIAILVGEISAEQKVEIPLNFQ